MGDTAEPRKTVFAPGPGRRRRQYVVSVLLMIAVAAVATLLGLLEATLLAEDLHVFAYQEGWYVFAIILLLSLWLGWRCVQSRLQLAVEVTDTQVHFGRGLLRRSVGCEDVEVIRVGEDAGARWLAVQAGGERRKATLDGDEVACAELLFERCPNAVYIDALGVEHRRTEAERPLYLINTLAHDRIRRGGWTLAFSFLFLAWGAPVSIVLLVQALRGQQAWGKFLDFRASVCLFAAVFGLLILLAGVARIRKGRRLVAAAAQLEQAGAGPEGPGLP